MISIVTSLYNSDKYLNKFLKNLSDFSKYLKQKNIDFELIIISNDVNENEKNILNRFSASYFIKLNFVFVRW